MVSPISKRLVGLAVALMTVALPPVSVAASTHGMLVARNSAPAGSMLETQFQRVRPPGSFLLVVTEPARTQLQFKWSVRCFGASHRASGGASGEATVSSGRWVKQIRANWIKHPAYCSGSVVGSATSSPVLVRVFAY